MADNFFVDTNILVYTRDASEPEKQAMSMRAMERLWRRRNGRTSVQVLNEFYVTVTRKLSPGLDSLTAWADVEALFAWDPTPTDRRLIERARGIETRYGFSWWDALVVAAAQRSGCAILLTEDLQDRQTVDGVRIVNPFAASLDSLL